MKQYKVSLRCLKKCSVPDQFVTQEMWHYDFDDDDELITWRAAYIKRKTQKAKIKKELMPVAWHPD